MSFAAQLEDGTTVQIADKSFDEARREVFTATDGTKYTRNDPTKGLIPYEDLGTGEGEEAQAEATPDAGEPATEELTQSSSTEAGSEEAA